MFKKSFYGFTQFRFLLVLSVFWVAMLVIVMIIQNTPPKILSDPTLNTLAQVQQNILSSEQAVSALPEPTELNLAKINLGLQLFVDPILSHDNSISCNSCHDLKKSGVDNLPVSVGINKNLTRRNSPTIFNSGFNFHQFWDGRILTLEEQVDVPLLNPKEMGSSWEEVVNKLTLSPHYFSTFQKIYNTKTISPELVRDAIATFERALVTLNSPFDRWLNGEQNALSLKQKEGYRLFQAYGCVSCHQGVNIGGNMFERVGIFREFYDSVTKNTQDLGRFEISGDENDRYEFKVPSLRNVALTAPYMHDGSISTLREMISIMAYHQSGVKLSEIELDALEDFLKSLTGESPAVLQ